MFPFPYYQEYEGLPEAGLDAPAVGCWLEQALAVAVSELRSLEPSLSATVVTVDSTVGTEGEQAGPLVQDVFVDRMGVKPVET